MKPRPTTLKADAQPIELPSAAHCLSLQWLLWLQSHNPYSMSSTNRRTDRQCVYYANYQADQVDTYIGIIVITVSS